MRLERRRALRKRVACFPPLAFSPVRWRSRWPLLLAPRCSPNAQPSKPARAWSRRRTCSRPKREPRCCVAAAATRDMYVGADGKVLQGTGSSTVGWRASGIPGSVAGFAHALEKYGSGKLTWADVCEPARRLAADGHLVSQNTAHGLRRWEKLLGQFEESKKIYLKNGAYWQTGELW